MRNELAERLFIVHLQDNDGFGDCHWIPFRGAIDWNNVIGFLKLANYKKPLNLEISYDRTVTLDAMTELEFVNEAYQAASKLTEMLKQ
jgi:sugar phosphate isomerase/epimerase